jgi:DNA-binding MarR family transcriptional regulator
MMAAMTRNTAASARELTDVVTRLRRALRRSIRSDYPWEARPMAQVEVLQSLRDSGPTRLGDLAARLHLAQSTVSSLVALLVADGLLAREVDPRDRRASVLELTDAGAGHLRDWDEAHQRRFGAALRALPRADRDRVGAALPALARLVAALEDADPAPE